MYKIRIMLTKTRTKTACVLIIGNEILTGRTADANLGFIGAKLMGIGVRLAHARTIPDIEEEIVRNLNEVRGSYDYIFTTGGIGPTHDDITATSVAKTFGVPYILNKEARERLIRHYNGEQNLNPGRERMAMTPEGVTLIDNPVSAAPGFKIGNVYVLAGVPAIMQAMLEGLLPTLAGGPPILVRVVGCKLPESQIATDLGALAARYAPAVEMGSYPWFRSGGALGLSLVLRGTDLNKLLQAEEELCVLIRKLGDTPVRAEEDPGSAAFSRKGTAAE